MTWIPSVIELAGVGVLVGIFVRMGALTAALDQLVERVRALEALRDRFVQPQL